MAKKIRKDQSSSVQDVKLEPIPSSNPEARDEGPRLLPLRPPRPESLAGQKYLDLADRALGHRNSK